MDRNRVNSGDRKRQGPAVVHCAGLSRAPRRDVIGTGGTSGALEPGREHRRDNASLWWPLPEPRPASGPSHRSFSEGISSFSALLFCSTTTCSPSHMDFLQSKFLTPFPAKLSLSRRCRWFSPGPEFSESELSYLLIGARDVT